MRSRLQRFRFLLPAILALLTGFWLYIEASHRGQADRLTRAIHEENLPEVERLLEDGVSPWWEDSYGLSGMEMAEKQTDPDILHLVRSRGQPDSP